MDKFLEGMKNINNLTFTENGAVAFKSTKNAVLDAFSKLGAMKNSTDQEIIDTFFAAFKENKEQAMRLLFYVRDIRGGQGMRRVFRVIMQFLAKTYPEYVINNLDNFLYFGRGDDLFCLFDTPCEKDMLMYVREALTEDLIKIDAGYDCSLLGKWMPSCNTSSKETRALAKRFIDYLEVTPAQYRKMLSTLRRAINIVEAKMSTNEWQSIDFAKLPAKAQILYRNAFVNRCTDAYINYLKAVAAGEATINAASLFPVDIIQKVHELYMLNRYNYRKAKNNLIANRCLYNAMWEALPNYLKDTNETAICMCDTSGSMDGIPLIVALSLGIYCADKCVGPFKNHFITFDYKPTLQELKGEDIFEKVSSIREINVANTNFEAALQLILNTAIKNNLKQEEIPSKLYVISDMQFDNATGQYSYSWGKPTDVIYKPFMQTMKEKFAAAGYTMPAIVYWNVKNSTCGMFHETIDGEDCCMVSGYSPSLFKAVIDGTEYIKEVNKETGNIEVKQKLDPIKVMEAAIMAERYDRVWF